MLKQGDLTFREATKSDAKVLCDWWNDGSVMEHAGFPTGIGTTVAEVENIIQKSSINNQLLILEYQQKPIGEMSYRTVEDGVAEIGIKICDFSMQDKGIGTIYMKMFITYLFNELGYQKIMLDTNLNNKRAQHFYEKLGFKKVRVNQDAWKNQLGELQTSVDYEFKKEDHHAI